jgi:chromosomal replication initiation ATPase DnaA
MEDCIVGGEWTEKTQADRARVRLASQLTAYAFGVEIEEVVSATRRSAEASLARQVSMYLAHVAFGLPMARVAQAFGRDRSTAAHACHRVEDRRDDPEFDARLDRLETCLKTAPDPVQIGGRA